MPIFQIHTQKPMRKKAQKEARLKSPYRGKPNEKQGPKTHQEDRRASKVQRKKCKGKQSTAKCKSTAEYRSATEYKSVVEYSSSVEWIRQIKTNWAQDPFDPVNIIWPTKAQILLYKKDRRENWYKEAQWKETRNDRKCQQQESREGKKSQTKGKWQT